MARTLGIALLLLVAAAGGFVGYRLWSGRSAADAATTATRRPNFTLNDLAAKPQPISQWDGKVLLVNFWATWCEPCRREIPLLDSLQSEYAERGVQVIGVAIDDAEEVKAFLGTMPVRYPVMVGEQDAVDALAAFGAEMTVLPYTAFVGRDGHIETLHAGELHRNDAVKLIEKLL